MKIGVIVVTCVAAMLGAGLEARLSLVGRVAERLTADPAIQEDALSNNADDHLAPRREVPCPPRQGAMVALIAGQSNTANFAERRTVAGPRVSVFYHGRCYEARDPLLGATGQRGSVWPAFADRVIASKRFKHVLLVPAGVGGTSIGAWAPGGVLYDRIEARLLSLSRAGYAPTHILFGQGEFEAAGGDGADYARHMATLVRALKSTGARVIYATTSVCGDSNPAIRHAQVAVRRALGVDAGPDMDAVNGRINGCHLGARAQSIVAQRWAETI